MRRLTTEQFIARARQAHGDRYDYAQTDYQNSSKPVVVICPVHGPFMQIPSNHLSGRNCKYCARNQRLSAEETIRRFRAIHGDRYTYDAASLTDTKARIKATCKFHGPFLVSFYQHLRGAGCPRCTNHYQHAAKHHFRRRARAIHGPKYRYGKYTNASRKMRIDCPTHGVFLQSPASHLSGHGCPRCANDRKRLVAKGGYSEAFFVLHPDMIQHPAHFYIVEFRRVAETFLKVGITRTAIASRFKSGYREYSRRLIAVRSIRLYQAFCLEQDVLWAFKCFQVFPKCNTFVGKTECLSSSCSGELRLWLAINYAVAMSPNPTPSTKNPEFQQPSL